ncbi:MAG: SDR family oxidoreductase [Candidatus Moranbacteria bacterium]|nr:SDR family oxidoreductase [Candidatus Moranbacteria bacterium]
MKNNPAGAGKTALITGASSGIGRAIAGELAKRGCKTMILVSRNRSELEKVATDLKIEHGTDVFIIAQDLSESDAAEKVYAQVSALGLSVEIVVNNAGFAIGGPIVENDIGKMTRMMNVHMICLALLTRLFAADMVARGNGLILNVSSVAGFTPVPFTGLYAATKAFINSFSVALNEELDGTGVTCTVLCPGGTQSEMMKRAGLNDTLLFNRLSFLVMSSEDVASAGVDGMFLGKRIVIPGIQNKGLAASCRILSKRLSGKIGILLLANRSSD